MCRQSATLCLPKSPTAAQRGVGGVAERLAVLRDPRDRQGRRHSLVSVLLTACCAVLAGARFYLAVGQWARHAFLDALARLGVRAACPLGAAHRRASPSAAF
ncbi:transposase family protein [Streptomyces sp. NPDC050982]|uniref:transposase family protein n=1 Tax=Streptomyces sp. NPDC050982 TaxID=3154746 RepID=UPI0034035C11